jgi:hypothetical protein
MSGDGTQLTIDAKHWNRINLKERQVSVQLDLTYDVEWQLNAPKKIEASAKAINQFYLAL